MKEGVDNADLALARMRVVGTKNCLYGTCQDCVTGFQMIAMESHSCRGLLRNRLQNKSPEEFQGLTSKASDVSTKLNILNLFLNLSDKAKLESKTKAVSRKQRVNNIG